MKKILILVVVFALVAATLAGCAAAPQTASSAAVATSAAPAASVAAASAAPAASVAAASAAPAATWLETSTMPQEADVLKPQPRPAAGRTIGFAMLSGSNALCQEMNAAILKYVTEQGDKLTVLDSKFDVATEVANLEDFISKKVDGIVMETVGYETSTAQLLEAQKAGIPLVACDQQVRRDDLVLSQPVSDNTLAGVLAAKAMIAKLGTSFKCMIINIPGQAACDAREKGFRDTVAAYPGIEIQATGNGTGVVDVAAGITENLMQAHPDCQALFCINDPNAIGALSAYKSAGKEKSVLIYSVDGSPEALKYIKEGLIAGDSKQDHTLMGLTAIKDLYAFFNGQKIADRHPMIPVFMVDSSNVDQYLK